MRTVVRLLVVFVFVAVVLVVPVTPGALDRADSAAVAEPVDRLPAPAADPLPPYSQAVYDAAVAWWVWYLVLYDAAAAAFADMLAAHDAAEAVRETAPARGAATVQGSGGASGDTLAAIRACESGGDYGAVSPGGQYRGAYQFDLDTWAGVGGTGDPAAASPAEQDYRAGLLYAERGAQPWPNCGR